MSKTKRKKMLEDLLESYEQTRDTFLSVSTSKDGSQVTISAVGSKDVMSCGFANLLYKAFSEDAEEVDKYVADSIISAVSKLVELNDDVCQKFTTRLIDAISKGIINHTAEADADELCDSIMADIGERISDLGKDAENAAEAFLLTIRKLALKKNSHGIV